MTARELLARIRAGLRCVWYGHTEECIVERGRILLRCTTCGHESPGWRLYTDPPTDDSNG